ncbi:hypothetical protein EGW08_023794 [Elysia chlorotica]|uniref:Reverse transcriptase domain-containing protein n=1 Tax=Elysia chlorotica TaxID=188477 RepID=A0A3S1APS9_ELYCH|nr:hypothetical protein EGW08_023794 [Elysia chlorotica]
MAFMRVNTLGEPAPPAPPDIPPLTELLDINTDTPYATEIAKAILSLKTGKAAGPNGLPPEALTADIQIAASTPKQDLKKTPLFKAAHGKNNLFSCGIWRGIMLLFILGKMLTRIMSERLETTLEKRLRDEQAGVCTDHIATMRIIIEQSLEWRTPLNAIFGNFQKAFSSVDRDVIWRLMYLCGFPPDFATIEDATFQVIHDGKLTEPFNVKTDVHACLLADDLHCVC